MSNWLKRAGRNLWILALLACLMGLLLVYGSLASGLRTRVYSTAQLDYLNYQEARYISQAAPVWNTVLPGGEVVPAALADWQTRVDANLDAHYEEQNDVSVTVYDLEFESEYSFSYPGPALTTTLELIFPFPNNLETLHDVRFTVDGLEPQGVRFSVNEITWRADLAAGDTHQVAISYRGDGVNSFGYSLSRDRRADVDIAIVVDGLTGSQVPLSALPVSEESQVSGTQETFAWRYIGLIPSRDIQLELPQQLSFTQRVAELQSSFKALAALAPVFVFLFLISLGGLFNLAGLRMPIESYLLVGLCLALFYPALTFLSGLVPLVLAVLIACALVAGLVIVFLGLSLGWRQTWWRAGWLLLIFLGVFSLGMLTPWRGLLLTFGGLLFVGTFMLAYARRPAQKQAEPAPLEAGAAPAQPSPMLPPASVAPERYCPLCGLGLALDYHYCPGCGYDASDFVTCKHCGHSQLRQADLKTQFCLKCGKPFVS